MALISCSECGREISDKAAACPGCGAPALDSGPMAPAVEESEIRVKYDRPSNTFIGTMPAVVKLAMRAVHQLGLKVDNANESLGFVTFETGVSWGSWSGVSCALQLEQVDTNSFRVVGSGKQNIRGGQLIALNLAGEAQGRALKAIEAMRRLAVQTDETESESIPVATRSGRFLACPWCGKTNPAGRVECQWCHKPYRES